jgi:hypothetical protein
VVEYSVDMHRRLSLVLTLTVLAASCGEVVDASGSGGEVSASTTTSTALGPTVVTYLAKNQPGGVAAAQAEAERLAEMAAAAAVLTPSELALQAKAEDIVERFRREPGLVGVGARHDEGVVHVLVNDLTLYDTLLEEFQSDPEVVVAFSEEAVVYLPIGAISPNSPSD